MEHVGGVRAGVGRGEDLRRELIGGAEEDLDDADRGDHAEHGERDVPRDASQQGGAFPDEEAVHDAEEDAQEQEAGGER